MSTHEQTEDITIADASGCPVNSSPACAGAGDLGRSDMNIELQRPSIRHRPIDFAPEVLLGQNVPSYRHNRPDQCSDSRFQNGDIVGGRYQPSRNRPDRDDCLDNIQDILRDMRTTVEQQRQPIHNQRPRVMPDTFDGRGSWTEYLAHFETVADLNQWHPGEKVQYLAVSLRGEACQAMRFLTPEVKQNYQGLVAALNRRFNPGNRTELFRIQLRNRTRRDKESIPQLAQSIRHLVLQAFPQAHGELFEVLCRDHFLDALGDSHLRFKIFQAHTETFDETVAAAIEMEAFQQAERQRHSRRFVREISGESSIDVAQISGANAKATEPQKTSPNGELLKQIENLTKAITEMKSQISKPNFNHNDRKPFDRSKLKCWNCGELGHTQYKWPKPAENKDSSHQKPIAQNTSQSN